RIRSESGCAQLGTSAKSLIGLVPRTGAAAEAERVVIRPRAAVLPAAAVPRVPRHFSVEPGRQRLSERAARLIVPERQALHPAVTRDHGADPALRAAIVRVLAINRDRVAGPRDDLGIDHAPGVVAIVVPARRVRLHDVVENPVGAGVHHLHGRWWRRIGGWRRRAATGWAIAGRATTGRTVVCRTRIFAVTIARRLLFAPCAVGALAVHGPLGSLAEIDRRIAAIAVVRRGLRERACRRKHCQDYGKASCPRSHAHPRAQQIVIQRRRRAIKARCLALRSAGGGRKTPFASTASPSCRSIAPRSTITVSSSTSFSRSTSCATCPAMPISRPTSSRTSSSTPASSAR